MALSPAEKQRRYRERQKATKAVAPDLSLDFVQSPLSGFEESPEHLFDFTQQAFTHIGFDFPLGFFDERFVYDVDSVVGAENSLSGKPLLERMEVLAGAFLDAATEVYATINKFKVAEIDARIAEIKQADLSDPDAKSKALQDIVALQGIKASLEGKTFRRSFAEIKVKSS